jgi:hypothetical protein
MPKVGSLSGRVKKVPSTQVDPNRYEFLDLQNAEPDLGVASGNSYILTSDELGTRTWINPSEISGFLGSTGFTGSQGDIGFTGSQGIQGFTGSIGFTGSVGFTGSKGDAGEAFINADGGTPTSIYGGISPIDGGNV